MSRYVTSFHVMSRHVSHVMYHVTSYHVESRGTVTRLTLHCQLTSSTRNQYKLSMTVFVGCPEGCRYNTASAKYDLVILIIHNKNNHNKTGRNKCKPWLFNKPSSTKNQLTQLHTHMHLLCEGITYGKLDRNLSNLNIQQELNQKRYMKICTKSGRFHVFVSRAQFLKIQNDHTSWYLAWPHCTIPILSKHFRAYQKN